MCYGGEGMPSTFGAIIDTVVPGSIAAELGIKPGDEIMAINDQKLQDLIDYQYAVAEEYLTIRIKRPDGQTWTAEIEKDYDDDLGIGFSSAVFDGIRRCQNACVFCFVDQMPAGMRSTLYVKDDDYRLSFLYGNFITLTNLTEVDYARILRLHMSPLYISVHTTDPFLRKEMLRQPKAAEILTGLKRLLAGGTDVHTQIVLCPGINDEAHLEKTIRDLSELGPGVLSIAIVPVGLTKYRANCFPLRTLTSQEAAAVIAQVAPWQQKFMEEYGEALVYLADEFYLSAGAAIPDYDHYGDFPQLENGVGLARLFIDKWEQAVRSMPAKITYPRKVSLVAGSSAARVLGPLLEKFNVGNLAIQLITVPNRFFGEDVTVTGLLTGRDIVEVLKNADLGDAVIIPGAVLRQGDEVFLDDLTVDDVAAEIPVPIHIANEPEELLEIMLNLSDS